VVNWWTMKMGDGPRRATSRGASAMMGANGTRHLPRTMIERNQRHADARVGRSLTPYRSGRSRTTSSPATVAGSTAEEVRSRGSCPAERGRRAGDSGG